MSTWLDETLLFKDREVKLYKWKTSANSEQEMKSDAIIGLLDYPITNSSVLCSSADAVQIKKPKISMTSDIEHSNGI